MCIRKKTTTLTEEIPNSKEGMRNIRGIKRLSKNTFLQYEEITLQVRPVGKAGLLVHVTLTLHVTLCSVSSYILWK